MQDARLAKDGIVRAAARKLAPLVLAGALSSCLPFLEPANGTSVSYMTDCHGFICNQAALLRTTKRVSEGDTIEGARVWSSVMYRGWVITRIGSEGVELRPVPNSSESVVIPYGRQESVGQTSPYPENFESSLSFERGFVPGTAIMTIVEKPAHATPYAPPYMR